MWYLILIFTCPPRRHYSYRLFLISKLETGVYYNITIQGGVMKIWSSHPPNEFKNYDFSYMRIDRKYYRMTRIIYYTLQFRITFIRSRIIICYYLYYDDSNLLYFKHMFWFTYINFKNLNWILLKNLTVEYVLANRWRVFEADTLYMCV